MAGDLTAYVPRLLLQWGREHGEAAKHQAIEGTLAFADVSGFTRLSERLAKRGGKAGAEQMTDVINSLFGDLLTVAAARGGEMLKYGGDAMLLFFRGDAHATRAVAACLEMQRRLGEIGRVDTGAGVVRLRMSVGAHTGVFDIFVVGRSHRELVIGGPAASVTVAMEAAADATEVLVSDATAALLDPRVLGDAKAGGRLVRRVPDAPVLEPVPRDADVESERFVSVALREHLDVGVVDPEHRLVTQAFVHVAGLDDALDQQGTRIATEWLDATMTMIQDACAAFDVSFLASDIAGNGTKAILVAGAPRTVDAADERVLRALRRVFDSKPPLAVRAGVHRGHVFVGDVGPPFRRTYTTIGDVTNSAARVMAHAKPGEILVLGSVAELVDDVFELEARDPFNAKGKSEPLVPFAVGHARERSIDSRPDDDPTGRLPLVARADEVATLVAAATSAVDGGGRFVEISGDMGIGKSRLVAELLQRFPTMGARTLRCEPYERATPFFPFRHLLAAVVGLNGARGEAAVGELRRWIEHNRPALTAWLPLVAEVLDLDVADTAETAALDASFRRQRTASVVIDLLDAALAEPTVLVFEDVHWMDDASCDLLRRLESQATTRPWLVVATRRNEDTGFRAADDAIGRIALEPLDAHSITTLVDAATADAPLPPHRRDLIAQRSGGNPLFVEALLRAATPADDAAALPESIEAVVAAEIDALTPAKRRLVRCASVLGSSFDVALLAATVADVDGAADARKIARRVDGVLVAEGRARLRFRHQLLRDVAYEALPYRERRELHGRAADVLVRELADAVDDRVGVLSLHLFHAHRHHDCWSYARIAGERAATKHANVEAVTLFERALMAARSLDGLAKGDLADVCESLGDAAQMSWASTRARDAYRRARRLTDDPVVFARLCRKHSRLAEREANRVVSRRWLRRAIRVLDGVPADRAARERSLLYASYAWTRYDDGAPADAVRYAELAIADGMTVDNREAIATAYGILDGALVALGRAAEATHGAQAVAIYDELGKHSDKAVVLNNLGAYAYYQGKWTEALDLYEQARAANLKAGNVADAGFQTFAVAELLTDRGRLDEADALLDEVETLWRSVHASHGLLYLTGQRGLVALRRGDLDRAIELIDEARAEFERNGLGAHALPFDVARAECALRLGDLATAHDIVTSRLQLDRAAHTPFVLANLHRMRAFLYAAQGDDVNAFRSAEDSLRAARAAGSAYDVALGCDAFVVLGELTDQPVDPAHCAERDELWVELGLLHAKGGRQPAPPVGPDATPPLAKRAAASA